MAGEGGEGGGVAGEAGEGGEGLGDERVEARFRAGEAIYGNGGGLAAGGVGADGLAELFGGGGGVEEVVGDLEGLADGGGVAGGGREGVGGAAGGEDAHTAGAHDEVAGLVLLDVAEAVFVGGEVFAEHVFDLAADNADGAGGVGEFADDLEGMDGGLGGEFEGEGLEGVAGEKGDGFAVDLVAGGDAAAEIFVIHAGEVVVDEGVGVEALDGGGGEEGGGAGGAASTAGRGTSFGGSGAEEGSEALAAGEEAVAHGGVELLGAGAGGEDEAVEGGFDPAGAVGQVFIQVKHVSFSLKILTPSHEGTESSLKISIDDPGDSIPHQGFAEIQQEAEFHAGQSQIGQNLFSMGAGCLFD